MILWFCESISFGCDTSYGSAVSTCSGSLPEAPRFSCKLSLMEFGWSVSCFPAKYVCVRWGLHKTTRPISQDTTIACDHWFSLKICSIYCWEVVTPNTCDIWLFISHTATWYTWRSQILGMAFLMVQAWLFLLFLYWTEHACETLCFSSAVLCCVLRAEYDHVAVLIFSLFQH